METLLNELRARALRHADGPLSETAVPGVVIGMHCGETLPAASLYEPVFCLVLQGAKRVTIGDKVLRYDAANYFLASLDLPVTSWVIEATPEKPYVVLALRIDAGKLASLLTDVAPGPEIAAPAFGVSPVTAELLEVWLRIAKLFEAPEDVPALAPLAEQELLYRLLRGPQGGVLRQFARADSRLSRVRRAIAEIRSGFDRPLRIDALARGAGMSAASFHRHFKAATALSPLQYQKMLRLQQARTLLIANDDAARAAYAVGYESASQFSREYARLFGAPPARDAARLRAIGELPA
ncbi:AraC family transcriptional regulator [Hansschlegelia zhihuaiae]|uniref:AraC family transcriptional regulator n=1 Tax=Hansschlegelia zhihuaiae TaxID=405005 RepID=A0A4Q0MDF1_9HYPH|nr:AraC family transcriptional regulator [Hansschlegelia zhihuaiae]RXF70836.1 AraC family transcriptional regulator [Hansschlegelia zhihuaiae]